MGKCCRACLRRPAARRAGHNSPITTSAVACLAANRPELTLVHPYFGYDLSDTIHHHWSFNSRDRRKLPRMQVSGEGRSCELALVVCGVGGGGSRVIYPEEYWSIFAESCWSKEKLINCKLELSQNWTRQTDVSLDRSQEPRRPAGAHRNRHVSHWEVLEGSK